MVVVVGALGVVGVVVVVGALGVVVGDEHAATGVQIFPNPASESINVLWKEGFEPGARVQLLDLSGRVVLDEALHENQPVQIGHLQNGQYMLRLTTSDSVIARPLFLISE